MSRIGVLPIAVPGGVKIDIRPAEIHVTGPLATLTHAIPPGIQAAFDEEKRILTVKRTSETKHVRALHGTARSRIASLVLGVTQGFKKGLIIGGVGYQAKVEGKELILQIGFSHPVKLTIPDGLKVVAPTVTTIQISGADKPMVGQFAAEVRSIRPPEPYKGKGIRYSDEQIRRKQGKTFAGGE